MFDYTLIVRVDDAIAIEETVLIGTKTIGLTFTSRAKKSMMRRGRAWGKEPLWLTLNGRNVSHLERTVSTATKKSATAVNVQLRYARRTGSHAAEKGTSRVLSWKAKEQLVRRWAR